MEKQQALKRAAELKKLIEKANEEYYDSDNPSLEDFQYDLLTRELKALEAEFPELKTSDSPTQHVGGKASELFSPVVHDVVMESLQDVFSYEELREFDARVRGTVGQADYVVERKIDGLSISLEYENGVFVRGSTRGDGHVGEDVTANLTTIENIPKVLVGAPEFLEVRGEVYMPKAVFAELVNAQIENGETPFKNPRNAAAGSLRQKDREITRSRRLAVIVFNVQRCVGREFLRHSEALDFLGSMGFQASKYFRVKSVEEIISAVESINAERRELEFDIDGAVIKTDELSKRALLGSTAKFPRWAAAYKYPPEIKATRLLEIHTEVGRTGVVTPTAIFEPVLLAGTSVSRAVLHNQDFIDEKGIAVGDIIEVRKAGDIIPEVLGVKERCGAPVYKIPDICPACGDRAEKDDDGPAVRCVNPVCPAKRYRALVHFASKAAMDIDGLGPAIVSALLENKLVEDISDLYTLTAEQISPLEKMGEKSAAKLIAAIDASRNNDLSKLLCGLGIRHVGVSAAEVLATEFGNIDALASADPTRLACVEGVGEITARVISEFFADPNTVALIDRLKQRGVNTVCRISRPTAGALTGKIFVLTGALSRPRDEFEALIKAAGGKASGSVSAKTSYVVAGEAAGSKLKNANELGIPVLSEQQLLALLENKD